MMINHKSALSDAAYDEHIAHYKTAVAQRVIADEDIKVVVSKICELVPVIATKNSRNLAGSNR